MTQSFSYAVVLHRMFDSAPPEKEPRFCAGGHVLRPYKKPGGLYVFVDEPEQTVELVCGGYQPERFAAKQGETRHVCLYADSAYCPPAGWSATLGRAPPGSVSFIPDERYDIRLLSFDSSAGVARLQSRPGFIGGCLRLTKGDSNQVALILGKEPPDRYYLSALGTDFSGGKAEKGYAARADAAGSCVFVTPQGFSAAKEQEKRDAL